jgi:hypothetical protein
MSKGRYYKKSVSYVGMRNRHLDKAPAKQNDVSPAPAPSFGV